MKPAVAGGRPAPVRSVISAAPRNRCGSSRRSRRSHRESRPPPRASNRRPVETGQTPRARKGRTARPGILVEDQGLEVGAAAERVEVVVSIHPREVAPARRQAVPQRLDRPLGQGRTIRGGRRSRRVLDQPTELGVNARQVVEVVGLGIEQGLQDAPRVLERGQGLNRPVSIPQCTSKRPRLMPSTLASRLSPGRARNSGRSRSRACWRSRIASASLRFSKAVTPDCTRSRAFANSAGSVFPGLMTGTSGWDRSPTAARSAALATAGGLVPG